MSSNETQRTEISSIGEFKLIERLTADFPQYHASTIKGPSDDAAVINANGKTQVVTTDILVEGIHFDLMYTPLKHLGYKSVVVNLSDVYAMNARPKQILVSLAVSNRFSVEALEELYAGIRAACEKYRVDLIGGDTTASNKGLVINVVAIGEANPEELSYRNTAKEGDLLCVTGDLGGAYIGLQLLEREKRLFLENPGVQVDLKGNDYTIGRQLKPEARADIYDYLQEQGVIPTSMIDISDGLSSEILHLCNQSGLGCQLEEAHVPIARETFNTALDFKLDPITCALSGGEDYELLFTIKPEDKEKVYMHPEISVIGEMLDSGLGVKLHTKGDNYHDIISLGWDSIKE
jgi:thiamine-monophosphate kinase